MDELTRLFDELSAEEQFIWLRTYLRTLKNKRKGLLLVYYLFEHFSNTTIQKLLFDVGEE